MSGFHAFNVRIGLEGSSGVRPIESLQSSSTTSFLMVLASNDLLFHQGLHNGHYFSVASSEFISWNSSMKDCFPSLMIWLTCNAICPKKVHDKWLILSFYFFQNNQFGAVATSKGDQ